MTQLFERVSSRPTRDDVRFIRSDNTAADAVGVQWKLPGAVARRDQGLAL
jgi:hypothetical protein